MKAAGCVFAVCLLMGLVGACAHKPEPVPDWSYSKEAIRISYTADAMLNAFGNKPHVLLLVVYQMKDVNAFSELTKNEETLKTLLKVGGMDQQFLSSDKFFIEPGEKNTVVFNRAEHAEWVGIVAGYYNLDPGKVSRIFEIPFKIETRGFIMKKKVASIETLTINLILGKHGIQIAEREKP
jgi:type VI secretion system VasD/TssJ family lipoprotein